MTIGFHSYEESNEQTELTKKMETDSQMQSSLTAPEGRNGDGGRGGGNKQNVRKEKGLMDTDNRAVIVGAGGQVVVEEGIGETSSKGKIQ